MCTETLFENTGNNTVCLINAGVGSSTSTSSGRKYKPVIWNLLFVTANKITIPLLDI